VSRFAMLWYKIIILSTELTTEGGGIRVAIKTSRLHPYRLFQKPPKTAVARTGTRNFSKCDAHIKVMQPPFDVTQLRPPAMSLFPLWWFPKFYMVLRADRLTGRRTSQWTWISWVSGCNWCFGYRYGKTYRFLMGSYSFGLDDEGPGIFNRTIN
jgi:hypothetical protein